MSIARLDRNESPFGTDAGTLAAWERQRTADPRKYGLNRYPDFVHTDQIRAMQARHGLSVLNYTALAGNGETANVLADALVRGGELVQSWPIEDPVSARVRAWGGRVKRVPLDHSFRQDLRALAAAVDAHTSLVHLQNPHSPSGTSFGASELEQFIGEVAGRNTGTHVWIEESYEPYTTRGDFPDCFAIIARDPEHSKLCVSRSLGAFGCAGAQTAYLAASQQLTQQTEGLTGGFVVPNVYGWANPEGGVSRMGEKAVLDMLADDGQAWLRHVNARNAGARRTLGRVLTHHGLRVFPSDASFVLARSPHPGLVPKLRAHGVLVLGPRGWGRRYRRMLRVSVGSGSELRKLDRALARVVGDGQVLGHRVGRRSALISAGAAGVGAAAGALPAIRFGGAAAAGALPAISGGREPARVGISRRDFVRRAGLTGAGAALLLADSPRSARAFPPDEFFDEFNLARMIYHENPVGPSEAGLEAVRRVLGGGAACASRYLVDDPSDLVAEILRYNRRLHPAAKRLNAGNALLTVGSSEGLMLAADTFVAGGTMVSEWPSYRIIRERVWQQGGTVVDVALTKDGQPDYAALLRALDEHPHTGLVHFNAQNNPVGTVMQRGPFDAFAKRVFAKHPNTVILIDESDHEWMEPGWATRQPDYLRYVARNKNLIHLQTFSHIFGLTGLRLGYVLAPQRLIRRMRRKRVSHPVSVFAHAAGIAALRDADAQIKRCLPVVSQGREYLYSQLDKMGLRYQRSQGQYVFLDTGADGTAVWSGLIGLGVLTRYGREWGMEQWLRVCPGLPEENERFISSLKAVLARPDVRNPPCIPLPLPHGGCPPLRLPGGAPDRSGLLAGLGRKLALDTMIAQRIEPLRGSTRVTPASVFR